MLRRYFRNAAILGVAEVLLRLKALVVMPVLTKTFGALDYGTWAQVSVIASMVSPLIILGTDAAAARFMPGQSRRDIGRGLSTQLVYYCLVSGAVAALLYIFSRPLASTFFEGGTNAPFVVLSGGVILAGLTTNAGRSYYRIVGDGKAYSLISVVQAISGAVVVLVVVLLRGTIFQVVLAGVVADLLLALVIVGCIGLRNGLGSPDPVLLIKWISFGLPLVPAGYAMWGLNQANRLFITHYGSLQDLGVYSVVFNLGYMVIGLFFGPMWLMYPTAAAELYNQSRLADLNHLYRQSSRAVVALLVPAFVGVSLLAVPILHLLTTQEFARGASLVPLITLGYVCHMMASYFDISLGLVGKQIWSTISITAALFVNLALSFALIPEWGITGAAWAVLLGFTAQFIVSGWVGSRCIRLDFEWSFLLKVSLASFGMGAFLATVPISGAFSLGGVVVLGSVTYAFLLLLLRPFEHSEWAAILECIGLQRAVVPRPVRILLGMKR